MLEKLLSAACASDEVDILNLVSHKICRRKEPTGTVRVAALNYYGELLVVSVYTVFKL